MPLPPSIQPEPLSELLDRDLPPLPSYIAPSILPLGGILVFGGLSKIGKSMMMLEFARCLSSGDTPFACPEMAVPRPVKTLLIEQEIGPYGLKERGEKIWNDEERRKFRRYENNLWYLSKVPELDISTSKGLNLLSEICNEVQPNVLILDPLEQLHTYDDNNTQQIGQMFLHIKELQKLYEHNNMAVVFAHHFRKPGDPKYGYDPLSAYNFRGSSKFYNTPDSLITLDRTHDLKTPHKSWSLNVRFTVRHGEGLPEMVFHVNKENDLRVKYYSHRGGDGMPAKKLCILKPSDKKDSPAQLGFNAA